MTLSKTFAWILIGLLVGGIGFAAGPTFTNPVLAGDYPDPSVIRVGKEYWATATSSEWGPQFPLLHSRDLVNWKIVGPVFTERPDWAVGNFWAPEIAEWKGRYFIYYVARKKGGPLSLACATADRPEGPYTDHGPMVSQEAGSIDAVPVTNEKGERWLVWKEDGNSRRLPTPLWAQQLDETGTRLVGDRHELFRNDQPWEGGLVEGPFLLKQGEYFYMFYSANGCCGRDCTYAMGIARSKTLLGPWEKYSKNPILAENAHWKCPGHGSIVTDPSGRHWLLYHAYDPVSFVYTGREMLLDEVTFGADGWPEINQGKGPSATSRSPLGARQLRRELSFNDSFSGQVLDPGWQWPQDQPPTIQLTHGKLALSPTPVLAKNPIGGVVGRSTTSGDYVATTRLELSSLKPGVFAGLSAFGDPANALGVAVESGKVMVWQKEKNRLQATVVEPQVSGTAIYLRMTASGGNRFQFAVSSNGKSWRSVGQTADGGYLPPWDRNVRVALTAGGALGAEAQFDFLRIVPKGPRAASKR
jgi:xylan 1,4-beta-xylosidase